MLGGGLVDPAAPLIRGDDLGVLRGDGCFETMLTVGASIVALEPHLARLARSAAALGIPMEADRWRELAHQVASAWAGRGEGALRLVLTRGTEGSPAGVVAGAEPTGYATVCPVPGVALRQREEGVTVITLDRGLPVTPQPWLLAGVKTLSYAVNMAALRHARDRGVDDAIFTDASGRILEGPTSTVVWVVGDTLYTVPVTAPILAGITVTELFDHAGELGLATCWRHATRDDLLAADGVWLVSSVRRVAAVRAIDGAAVPVSPLTETIGKALLSQR